MLTPTKDSIIRRIESIKLKVKVNDSGNSFSVQLSFNGQKGAFSLYVRELNDVLNRNYWEERRNGALKEIVTKLTDVRLLPSNRMESLKKTILEEVNKLVENGEVKRKRSKYLKKRWFNKINAVVYEALENGVTKEEIHEAIDMAQVKQVLEN